MAQECVSPWRVVPMSAVTRGFRNVFRAKMRTIVVVLTLGFALAVFLSASMVSSTVSALVTSMSTNMETTIVVCPAGSDPVGISLSGDAPAMNESILADIWTCSNVRSVNPLITRIDLGTGDNPLQSARLIQALDPGQGLLLSMGGAITVESGRSMQAEDVDQNVAMVGKEHAATNGVEVGDTVDINGTLFTVVGIHSTGTKFGDRSVIIPYEGARYAYGLQGPTSIFVSADSIGTMNQLMDDLKALLGSEYDVQALSSITSQGAGTIQETIDSTVASSEFMAIVSMVTAGGVMAFAMVLATKERFKEIGIMKALGYKNSKILTQLMVESISLALIGFAVGLTITLIGAPYMVGLLADSESQSMGQYSSLIYDLQLSTDLVLVALLLIVMMGIIGSLYPVIRALRLRPAEALKNV